MTLKLFSARRMAALPALMAALTLLSAPLLRAQSYTLKDLGTLDNSNAFNYSDANGINDNGVVIGSSGIGSYPVRGYAWQNGVMNPLPAMDTTPNYDYSIYPTGINNNGQVAGTARDAIDYGNAPFLFNNNKMTNLFGAMITGPVSPDVTAINNAGIFVGKDESNKAFSFQNGAETPLALLPNTTLDEATAINNQNPPQIAGYGHEGADPYSYHAILWKNGTPIDLGGLGGPSAKAFGINDKGQIVGQADLPADAQGKVTYHAFLWTPGGTDGVPSNPQMKDLGTLFGGSNSAASAINANGQIIGDSDIPISSDHDYRSNTPFLWDAAHGMQYLTALIAAGGDTAFQPNSGWFLRNAAAINSQGQIVGQYATITPPGTTATTADHAYLLTPGGAAQAPGAPHNLQAAPAGPAAQARQGHLQAHLQAHVAGPALTLTWTLADQTASSVTVERQQGTGAWAQVASLAGDAQAYTDTGLAPATAYNYRVRAHNASGDSPYSNTAAATTTMPVTHTHMLWNNPDGKVVLWNVAPDGTSAIAGVYGPGTDGPGTGNWVATAIATGPDGITHMLWNNPDGKVVLWNVTPDGTATITGVYGPGTDGPGTGNWAATALSIGSDNVLHMLWNNPDGKVVLWSITPAGSASIIGVYGPATDGPGTPNWSATAISTGTDGITHMLWNNPDGKVVLWNVQADGTAAIVGVYGPGTDGPGTGNWSATALSTGPDNVTHMLWNNPDGKVVLWNVLGDGTASIIGVYGPGTDGPGTGNWFATAVSTGPDGITHMLWNNPDGKVVLWNVTNAGAASIIGVYGPGNDGPGTANWFAISLSSGS